MIATGTDIKPLECLLFLRDVRSRVYFEQMKGRGTRVLTPTDLQAVSGADARAKTHFVTSLSIEPDDFDYAPFSQQGGLGKAHQLFGEQLPKLLDELNKVLAA